jgi:hypothetical protein
VEGKTQEDSLRKHAFDCPACSRSIKFSL